MREQLENRLQALISEYNTGRERLRELDTQRDEISGTLLRISGAIQVLQEELAAEPPASPVDTPADSPNGAQPSDSHPNTSTVASGAPGHLG